MLYSHLILLSRFIEQYSEGGWTVNRSPAGRQLRSQSLWKLEHEYQWFGRFLGITGWDPSVCKSNRLHADILRFSFIELGNIVLEGSSLIICPWTWILSVVFNARANLCPYVHIWPCQKWITYHLSPWGPHTCEWSHCTNSSRFTLWTRKLSPGVARALIGCWNRPRTTSVYTKEKNGRVTLEVGVPNIHISRHTKCINMVQRVLRWEKQGGGQVWKGKGPWQRNALQGVIYKLFPPPLCALIRS